MLASSRSSENFDLIVAPESEETAGAITYWRLSGPVSVSALIAALAEHGAVVPLPVPPDDQTALRRAVQAQGQRRRLVRPTDKRGSWVVLDERAVTRPDGLQDVEHLRVCSVRYSPDTGPVIERLGHEVPYEAFVMAEDAIRNDYTAARGELDTSDIGAWLVKVASQLLATSLRDAGGVYFVPRTGTETWGRVVAALAQASKDTHKVFRVPALKNSEAIDAIMDAITTEAAREAAEMEAEIMSVSEALIDGSDQRIGVRALRGRSKKCEGVLSKISQYEILLGVKMDEVRARMERLQASVASVTMMAESADSSGN